MAGLGSMVILGGNSGVGKETVKALLEHNAKVYLAARSPERAAQAIEELKADTGKDAIFLQLDLSDLPSVRKAAEEFLSCASSILAWATHYQLFSGRRHTFMCSSTMRTPCL